MTRAEKITNTYISLVYGGLAALPRFSFYAMLSNYLLDFFLSLHFQQK